MYGRKSLDLAKIFKRKEGLPWQEMEELALVLVPHSQEAHELNETATFLWKHFDGENTVADILNKLSVEYDIDDKTAFTDLAESIDLFHQINLIDEVL